MSIQTRQACYSNKCCECSRSMATIRECLRTFNCWDSMVHLHQFYVLVKISSNNKRAYAWLYDTEFPAFIVCPEIFNSCFSHQDGFAGKAPGARISHHIQWEGRQSASSICWLCNLPWGWWRRASCILFVSKSDASSKSSLLSLSAAVVNEFNSKLNLT